MTEKRIIDEPLRVRSSFTEDGALRRLERYVPNESNGRRDFTRELFRAMLTHGPWEGRENIINWIFSPAITLFNEKPLKLQSKNSDECDDQALFERGKWWWSNLIMRGVDHCR